MDFGLNITGLFEKIKLICLWLNLLHKTPFCFDQKRRVEQLHPPFLTLIQFIENLSIPQ